MGFLEVDYPGTGVPADKPVLCSLPSYVLMLQKLTEFLQASHAASCNSDIGSVYTPLPEQVRCVSTRLQARFLGISTEHEIGSLSRSASLTLIQDSAEKQEEEAQPRAASQEPPRSGSPRLPQHARVRSNSRPTRPALSVTAAVLKSEVQEPDENVKAILKERQRLLSLACAGGGAASYGLSTTIGNAAIRAKCEAAFSSGRLLVTLAELVDAVVDTGFVSLPDAVAIVREEWWNGGLRLYDGAERLLQPHLISKAATQAELAEVVKALHTAQASPTCAHLSWPLLHSILVCFEREQLRSTFDLVLQTCSSAFGLKCSVWDIITAASLAPSEACVLEVAPWPVPYSELAEMEQNMLGWGMLLLNRSEGTDADVPQTPKVFPPYSKCLEKVVESEFNFAKLQSAIQVCLQQDQVHTEAFTVPLLLVRTASRAPLFNGLIASRSPLPCGALLWVVEKIRKAQEDLAKLPQGSGACSSGDITQVSSQRNASAAASRSLGSVSAVSAVEANVSGDECGSECDNESEPDEEGKASLMGMTPIEAFISCFYEDLVQHHPLYLSNVNNLYRMRSGGRGINYQKHGYSRMAEFLAEVPGVELSGSGNQMEVKMSSAKELLACAQSVMQGLSARIQKAQAEGLDTSQLQLTFAQPKAVPQRILETIWRFFQQIKDHEVPVNSFLAVFKQMYPNEKLHFRALGYSDFRGLMAQVRFVEKVGGRRHAKYKLKEGAVPPKRSTRSQPSSPLAGQTGQAPTFRWPRQRPHPAAAQSFSSQNSTTSQYSSQGSPNASRYSSQNSTASQGGMSHNASRFSSQNSTGSQGGISHNASRFSSQGSQGGMSHNASRFNSQGSQGSP